MLQRRRIEVRPADAEGYPISTRVTIRFWSGRRPRPCRFRCRCSFKRCPPSSWVLASTSAKSARCPFGVALLRPGIAEINPHAVAHVFCDVPIEMRDCRRDAPLIDRRAGLWH